MNRRTTLALALIALVSPGALALPGCGDVNADGALNILDALQTAQFAAGVSTLPLDAQARADVNGDTRASILDALLLSQNAAGVPVILYCPGMMPLSHAAAPPPATKLYVAGSFPDQVTIFDLATGAQRGVVSLGTWPEGIIGDPVRPVLYVSDAAGTVSIIDAATDTISGTFYVPGLTGDIDVTPDGRTLVGITATGMVIVDLPAHTVRHQVFTGQGGLFIAASPDSRSAWMSDTYANRIVKVNLATGAVELTVPVGNAPYGIDVSATGQMVFVINHGDQTLSRVDAQTGAEVFPRQPTGIYPMAVLGHSNGTAFAVNCISGNIGQHDPASGQQTAVFGVGPEPIDIHQVGGGDSVAVVNSVSASVSLVNPTTGSRVDLAISGQPRDIGSK
jgi:DNA-binding beta-propeller fold protein YncE